VQPAVGRAANNRGDTARLLQRRFHFCATTDWCSASTVGSSLNGRSAPPARPVAATTRLGESPLVPAPRGRPSRPRQTT